MQKGLNENQKWILWSMAKSLSGQAGVGADIGTKKNKPVFSEVFKISKAHSITPIIVEELEELAKITAGDDSEKYMSYMRAIEKSKMVRSLQVIFLTKKLCDAFDKAGINAVVLKGVTIAKYYSRPERRKSKDVDVLLYDLDQMEEAKEVVLSLGAHLVEEWSTILHQVFRYEKTNIDIELHTMIADPFDNKRMNDYMDGMIRKYQEHTEITEAFGIRVPSLTGAYFPFELLVHMLKHFLRSGFGLKLLGDWVVYWNAGVLSVAEKEEYLKLVKECGIKGFSDVITETCVEYLGLNRDRVRFMELSETEGKQITLDFLLDIFEGEEFGRSGASRMVALRGNSVFDYIREFHHQMRLNNPKQSRFVVLWPYLWIKTLVVFLNNNKKLRKVDTKAIIKNARKRGKLIKQMGIFN